MRASCYLPAFIGGLLLAGCASDPPIQPIQAVDRSIADRAELADRHQKLKVATVDRASINRTFYTTCDDALLKCGYSRAEADATAKDYVTHSAAWNAEIDRMRFADAAPLTLIPELAMWETVRARCQPDRAASLVYSNAATAIRTKARPEDRILINDILAASAMNSGHYAEAKVLLDDTLGCLGGISASDESAKKARNVFFAEDKKNFRGEPYERVMAYYYRGILYWMDGELDNARACFRSGQFEDSDTEHHEYACDYVLLDYLDGLITTKLGDDGSDAYRRSTTVVGTNVIKLLKPPPYAPRANVQMFVEFGKGPRKYAEGEYHEMLKIKPGRIGAVSAVVTIGDQVLRVAPYDDLAYQATTRGGRLMDHILKNKVTFKNTTKDLGTVLIFAAAVTAQNEDTMVAAPALLLLAGAAYTMSYLANPACDIRTWWNLPQYMAFASISLPAGEYQGSVQFLDAKGKPINCLDKSFTFKVSDQNKDTVLFVSDKDI